MKNKIARSLIVFVLICVTVITLMSFCACQKDDGTQQGQDAGQQSQDVPQYDSISAQAKRVYVNEKIENWDYKSKIEIVTVKSYLEEFNILDTSYSEDFFEHYVVMLIRFESASSDKNIEFKNLALKDGKFYPIFATNSPIEDEDSTDDTISNIYMVEVERRILDYEFADILVINRRDVNAGSCYHRSITTVFE